MKVESYEINGWEERETGILISEDENWILVNHIPTDYALDGFKLYRKKFIEKRISEASEIQIQRVLNLKKITIPRLKSFVFNDVLETLSWSESKYGLFEFQSEDETELFYGKVCKTNGDILVIDMIKSNGTIEENYDFEFSLKNIRSIAFETDYFQSVCLLMIDEMNKMG